MRKRWLWLPGKKGRRGKAYVCIPDIVHGPQVTIMRDPARINQNSSRRWHRLRTLGRY